tara:strand:+ start:2447 stop:2665 length:219 start_codon:yes stop_codon:yes gene_type:complete
MRLVPTVVACEWMVSIAEATRAIKMEILVCIVKENKELRLNNIYTESPLAFFQEYPQGSGPLCFEDSEAIMS